MTRFFRRPVRRAIGVAAVIATVAALAGCAAGVGYNVEPRQEALVKPGMTTSQVLSLLGQPSQRVKYRNQPGVTLTYRVLGPQPPMVFDVDFDADGKVASTGERMDFQRDGREGMGGLF